MKRYFALYGQLEEAPDGNLVDVDEYEELCAQIEELHADAERYRWLKMQSHVTWAPPGRAFAEGAVGDHLDAAIDALREENK